MNKRMLKSEKLTNLGLWIWCSLVSHRSVY